jgi:hypothetical protein
MVTSARASTLALALCLAGCGGHAASKGEPPPTTPLSVAEWQTLGVEQKYAPETFERLKKGNPKLQDEREWSKFEKAVIVPHRKKEIPIGVRAP